MSLNFTVPNKVIYETTHRRLPCNEDSREFNHAGILLTVTRLRGGCWTLTGSTNKAVLVEAKLRIQGKAPAAKKRQDKKDFLTAYKAGEKAMEARLEAARPEPVAKPVYHKPTTAVFRTLQVTTIKVVTEGEVDRYIAMFKTGLGNTTRGEGCTPEVANVTAFSKLPDQLIRKIEFAEYKVRREAARLADEKVRLDFNSPFASLANFTLSN